MGDLVFIVPGIMAVLLLISIFLRKHIKLFKKTLMPASIIAGVLGFILMNIGVIPIEQKVFEELAFHIMNLSFMSITLASTRKEEENQSKKAFKGGLWLALMWSGLYSLQAFCGGVIGELFQAAGFDFSGFLGSLNASGFAQGPGQALAIGRTWESFQIADAAQIGCFYAAVGYLSATLVGVPICNALRKKQIITNCAGEYEKEMEYGVYIERGKIMGYQTSHRCNLDTLTTHIAILMGTYLLTYLVVKALCSVIPDKSTADNLYNMMFIWGIFAANIVRVFMRKTRCDYLIDRELQTSITNFMTDTLIVACMMSISVQMIARYMIPIFFVCVVVVTLTAIVGFTLAARSGKYYAERFMALFGFATGTAVTGMLLLRMADSEYKTSVAEEIVWWNILQMLTAIVMGIAVTGPVIGFWTWMGINVLAMILCFGGAEICSRKMKG